MTGKMTITFGKNSKCIGNAFGNNMVVNNSWSNFNINDDYDYDNQVLVKNTIKTMHKKQEQKHEQDDSSTSKTFCNILTEFISQAYFNESDQESEQESEHESENDLEQEYEHNKQKYDKVSKINHKQISNNENDINTLIINGDVSCTAFGHGNVVIN